MTQTLYAHMNKIKIKKQNLKYSYPVKYLKRKHGKSVMTKA
jgi:hypothetical protein